MSADSGIVGGKRQPWVRKKNEMEKKEKKRKKNKERSKDGEKKKGYEINDYCKDEMERD